MGSVLSVLASPAGVVGIIAVVFCIVIYRYGYAPYGVLERCGIKGPVPRAIIGNYDLQKQGWIKLHQDLRKYGPISGHYFGCTPVVLVADAKILETIMITKFDNFKDRLVYLPYLFPTEGLPKGLFMATGDYWWKMRSALEPLFSTDNVKMMSNLVQRSCDTLVRKLGQHSGKSVDTYRILCDYSSEICVAALFGREVKIQDGEKDEFAEATKRAFVAEEGDVLTILKLLIIQSNFPCLKSLVGKLYPKLSKGKAFHVMARTTTEWLQSKKKATASPKYKDLMQLMMDTQQGSEGFTDEEIVSQTITCMIGVYENLANALGYTLYLLALNPSVQDRLRSEIKQFFQSDPTASAYDASQTLQYLDMVMYESVRLLTPVPRITRECLKTTEFDGFKIPAGAGVEIPAHLLHHDPQYWTDPLTFNPDRHTPEDKGKRPLLSLMPFGAGPRDCIGKKLALIMFKMAIVETLRKYQFIQAADTEVPLETMLGPIAMTPKNGIYLKVDSQN